MNRQHYRKVFSAVNIFVISFTLFFPFEIKSNSPLLKVTTVISKVGIFLLVRGTIINNAYTNLNAVKMPILWYVQ